MVHHPFVYVGCFVPFEAFYDAVAPLRREPLEREIKAPHVTFAYRPEEIDPTLLGQRVRIWVIGYGNNGQNEGVSVRLTSDDPVINAHFADIAVPHITIALSQVGKAVDTKDLTFQPVSPIEIVGTYGGYTAWGEVLFEAECRTACERPE